mmetsp:Transcript_5617/g.9781  ORF Transcript_5617/g.9781 Transcript_5617/m.9781 type:complete len:84 (+) Transcript_5617:223-474(+)
MSPIVGIVVGLLERTTIAGALFKGADAMDSSGTKHAAAVERGLTSVERGLTSLGTGLAGSGAFVGVGLCCSAFISRDHTASKQ